MKRVYISEQRYVELMAKAMTGWFTPSPKIIANKGADDPIVQAGVTEWYLESALPIHIEQEWLR